MVWLQYYGKAATLPSRGVCYLFDQGADGKNIKKGMVLDEKMPQEYLDK
jgi:hypothetical protein